MKKQKKYVVPNIVALIARGGHGKDTALDLLKKEIKINYNLEVEKESMAKFLKLFITNILELDKLKSIPGFKKFENNWYDEKTNKFISNDPIDILKDIPKNFEYNGIKSTNNFREILQKLGTEFFRNKIDNDFHVKTVIQRIIKNDNPNKMIVFTDIRFTNEENLIKLLGNEDNYENLEKFSSSFNIPQNVNELYLEFIKIVLGVTDKEIPEKYKKRIKNSLLKVKQLHSTDIKPKSLESYKFNSENKKAKIVRVFRKIDDKDLEEQKERYEKFNFNIKKDKNKIGFLRTGMDPLHESESQLALTKDYTEYSKNDLLSALNIEELNNEIKTWLKNNFSKFKIENVFSLK